MIDVPLEPSDPIRLAVTEAHAEPGSRLRRVIVFAEWEDLAGCTWITGWSDCSPWEAEGIIRYGLRAGLHSQQEVPAEDDE